MADRALFHLDNCYKWPSLRARGRIVRTHQASHTAFRGFGGPQVGGGGVECVCLPDAIHRRQGWSHAHLTQKRTRTDMDVHACDRA